MRQYYFPNRFLSLADPFILLALGAVIYGLVGFGQEWQSSYNPVTEIHLSGKWLPIYTFYSGMRGLTAYLISLCFTLAVGYIAARSPRAEKVILPTLDILQSVPVLGFLPGLVLGLIALFPKTNVGLELAAIISIFTGQVWNMTFSFYSSLKSIPTEWMEASRVMKLRPWRRFANLELPYSAMNLAWNSLMSMAGGWFFLSVCEAFTLGDHQFRLPGVGAYMAVAIAKNDVRAMWLGILAMVTLIVSMDFFIWRPVLAWVNRFRIEQTPGVAPVTDPLMKLMIEESRVIHLVRVFYRIVGRKTRPYVARPMQLLVKRVGWLNPTERNVVMQWVRRGLLLIGAATGAAVVIWAVGKLYFLLAQVTLSTWVMILRNTLWTFIRVVLTLMLSSLWAIPVGIWIGSSPSRVRLAQPIVQVLASFPVPMLYPLALGLFFRLHIGFDWGSMLLMMLGVQWYVLFNVLAGAMRIPQELQYALTLMKVPTRERWTSLYLPSVFPALVTGWVTAAGGAWNASVVAEYATYGGQTLTTGGLGSTITQATSNEDFPLLAASLVVMVLSVVLLNRTVWSRVYRLAQTRFRLDM